jgi:hypothetical protein
MSNDCFFIVHPLRIEHSSSHPEDDNTPFTELMELNKQTIP